jgi:signal peptidase I
MVRTTGTTEPAVRSIARMAAALAGVVVGALLVHRFGVFTTLVRSGSMRPTLEPGDLLLTSRLRRATRVRRGDLVVFRSRERGRMLVKRVVGLPGERIEIAGGTVRADGATPVASVDRPSGGYRGRFAVPSDGYLVLGDDPEASDDSRSWADPFVRRGDLLGIVRGRLSRRTEPPTVVAWRSCPQRVP